MLIADDSVVMPWSHKRQHDYGVVVGLPLPDFGVVGRPLVVISRVYYCSSSQTVRLFQPPSFLKITAAPPKI